MIQNVKDKIATGIINKDLCCGCLACVDTCPKSAISQTSDENGFPIPLYDSQACVNCGLCAKVCPADDKNANANKFAPQKEVIAARYNNPDIIKSSSSGGAFTYIAETFCDNNDYAIFGVEFKRDGIIKYVEINSLSDIPLLRGSKYAQSDAEGVYKRIKSLLAKGTKVLFCGAPCYVSALKSFVGENENLLCVDFICGGMATPKALKSFLDEQSKKFGSKIVNMQFRGKGKRFGLYSSFFITFTFENGKQLCFDKTKYMRAYFKHVLVRESCCHCKYVGTARTGDITIGDFWGIENFTKEFDEGRGVSILIANSPKGQSICNDIEGKATAKRYPIEYGTHKNVPLKGQFAYPKNKDKFLSDLKNFGFEQAYNNNIKSPALYKRAIAFLIRPFPYKLRVKILSSI